MENFKNFSVILKSLLKNTDACNLKSNPKIFDFKEKK
jgi:hypothetical protein